VIKRTTTYYLLLGVLFNVIALLLPPSHLVAPSHDRWFISAACAVATIFTALAVRNMYIAWRR
jgi:hypothetical protein